MVIADFEDPQPVGNVWYATCAPRRSHLLNALSTRGERSAPYECPSSSSSRAIASTTSGRPRPYHQFSSAPSITMLPIR